STIAKIENPVVVRPLFRLKHDDGLEECAHPWRQGVHKAREVVGEGGERNSGIAFAAIAFVENGSGVPGVLTKVVFLLRKEGLGLDGEAGLIVPRVARDHDHALGTLWLVTIKVPFDIERADCELIELQGVAVEKAVIAGKRNGEAWL